MIWFAGVAPPILPPQMQHGGECWLTVKSGCLMEPHFRWQVFWEEQLRRPLCRSYKWHCDQRCSWCLCFPIKGWKIIISLLHNDIIRFIFDKIWIKTSSFFSHQVKDLVAEEKNSESLVSVRNEGRPKEDIEEENLPKTKAGDSKQKSKGQEMDKIVDLPRKQQHPSLISKLCLGGSHERCINDKEEGCGALEHLSSQHDSYVKCVHHCVEHCKTKI